MQRRDFLKAAGIAGISLPAVRTVTKTGRDEWLLSKEMYGGFTVKSESSIDSIFEIDELIYQRFDEKNTMFSRAHWDSKTQKMLDDLSGMEVRRIKNGDPGYTLVDYAFNLAAWTGSGIPNFYRWTAGSRQSGNAVFNLPALDPGDFSPWELTDIVKKAALFFGASLVGTTIMDPRWVYARAYYRSHERSSHQGPIGAEISIKDRDIPVKLSDNNQALIPKACRYVVALVYEMDPDASEVAPSCIAAAATASGYARMALTTGTLAAFIRNLGYQAIPMGNDTALSIPTAIEAGLGELGRNGLLVTPKYGSRIRISKLFTDLPLVPDKPIRFGVTEFCETCKKCAKFCPSGSITEGPRTQKAVNMSTNPGTLKWPINAFSCYQYWSENGTDCNTCIYVCPYNKPQSWLHDAARMMIGVKSRALNKVALELDDACGYGKAGSAEAYWKKTKPFMHIKS
ncbi:MAG: reductive dehalogenase [Candidatus Aminicenantes bacterium]|nr:reductive dehalogenase [Candidatus Aminicenantes bacterium]